MKSGGVRILRSSRCKLVFTCLAQWLQFKILRLIKHLILAIMDLTQTERVSRRIIRFCCKIKTLCQKNIAIWIQFPYLQYKAFGKTINFTKFQTWTVKVTHRVLLQQHIPVQIHFIIYRSMAQVEFQHRDDRERMRKHRCSIKYSNPFKNLTIRGDFTVQLVTVYYLTA